MIIYSLVCAEYVGNEEGPHKKNQSKIREIVKKTKKPNIFDPFTQSKTDPYQTN